jgi:hypothetical protein
MRRTRITWLIALTRKRVATAAILCVALIGSLATASVIAQATGESTALHVRGGGTSIISGGTGAPTFAPVTTKVAFWWRDGEGRFECLALAPSKPAGNPGSGEFDTNAMYVTGEIESAMVAGRTVRLTGTATVTGLGAGSNVPFAVTATRGGPGARILLEVSGLTFDETLLEGEIRF